MKKVIRKIAMGMIAASAIATATPRSALRMYSVVS